MISRGPHAIHAMHARPLVTGVLVLAMVVPPLGAQQSTPAQRGGPPRSDTPQLVVSVLASADQKLGVEAADAIRKRIQDEHRATELYVIPGSTVRATLLSSGYNPDSALSTDDLVQLARQVRGDYALEGTVERTANGVRTSMRLVTERGQTLIAEPLAPIAGPDFGAVAKEADRAVAEALRALAFDTECMNALIVGDPAKAMIAARQGLAIRPASPSLRQCVLRTMLATHATPDSVIAVASALVHADSESTIGWASLADAYTATGDAARALEATRALHRLEGANVSVTASLVDRLVAANQPEAAVALLDTTLEASPGTPPLLRQRWLLELRLGRFASALTSGSALIAADSSAATVDYFERQLAAARGAHDTTAARALAADAVLRFPQNADFLVIRARDAIDEGQTTEALGLLARAVSIAPANATAWALAITAQARAHASDSAVATARRALAAGVAPDAVGSALVTVVTPGITAAQASQRRDDWEAVLRTASTVDSVAPSPRSAFYLGVAAYQVAADEAQSLATMMAKRSPTPADRQSACASATRVDDLASTVSIVMPRGGRVEPEIAGKILTALPSIADYARAAKQARCRARDE